MSSRPPAPDAFGANSWLIDEMYRQYRDDPARLSQAWRDFFADYQPATERAVSVPVATAPPGAGSPGVKPPAPMPAVVPPGAEPILGPARRLADNMQASLDVPTATSVRTVAVKLLEENRTLLNQHLAESTGGKVSFTHLVAWALVEALKAHPGMRAVFLEAAGTPYRRVTEHITLGLAVDVRRKDGSRGLVVPGVKHADAMDFVAFFAAFNEVLRRAQGGALTPDDFADVSVSLTNPGMLGTTHSIPRLMKGQSLILATGSIAWPPEYSQADQRTLAELGVSKVMTMTCTYDHRVIQGAESAAFLTHVAELLDGRHGFYEAVFASLRVPHEPLRLGRDTAAFPGAGREQALLEKQAAVLRLVNMYRVRGHLIAHTNPLAAEVPTHPELELGTYGLSVWDLDREFLSSLMARPIARLREILDLLRAAYCGTVAVEYMFIQEPDQRRFIQQRVEGVDLASRNDAAAKRRLLACLNGAEAFERFLHTKYVGHKRFSLEGLEALIPTLDRLLERAVAAGVEEVVLGMAHRGRLNVLTNTLGFGLERIFRRFEGSVDPDSREGTGDVKYHLGAEGTFTARDGRQARITLASNPSHLEAVDPVVEGMTRALQEVRGEDGRARVLPVLVHGDAAFAGQGVVAETLNLSRLVGYRTGGTVHIVTNNGIGFTTSPADARSSVYATDVAKAVQAPVFHVNGEDPEACAAVIEVALEFRNAFAKDVVVDIIGYRRWGHNEGDEPAFTQPLMVEKIRDRRSIRKLYTERLVNRGELSLEEAETALNDFQARLDGAFAATHESEPPEVCLLPAEPAPEPPLPAPPAVGRDDLQRVLDAASAVPDGFAVHPKLARLLQQRRDALHADAIDFGTAELLALGSLLLEGVPVRLSGQDSRRGTFSQRHAVLVDQRTGQAWLPLQHLLPGQPSFEVFDSSLSEYAVLGFEYGYAVQRPEALVLWEAQFGDFANGAQIIVDQFIAAAAEKWQQRCGLVLLLPHGFEGQGPEHSSARLERFLQLYAAGNFTVAVPSTAASYFHLLRAQAHRRPRAPMVILTPKSLLRAESARSAAADLEGAFRPVLPDPEPPAAPTRLVLSAGKVSHDLAAVRGEQNPTAMLGRLEQLAPFPVAEVEKVLAVLPMAVEVVWCQEEPRNQGAWSFVAQELAPLLGGRPLRYAGRPASGSPATGSARIHQAEQERLVAAALR